MSTRDARVDAYINKSAEFAQPILIHLRETIHKASPLIQEDIKWGAPGFMYKGLLCIIAAFKNHCALSFWKSSAMDDPDNIMSDTGAKVMGNLGKITSLKDLPKDKILIKYVKEAMRINEENIKVPKKAVKREKMEAPDDFLNELKKDEEALRIYTSFSPSKQKDYIEWILDAKTELTRKKRIETSVEWLSEGKPRMWKYMKN